jgi:hypothetical protein
MTEVATFRYHRETVDAQTPWSQVVVDTIKASFHQAHREWNPEHKTWRLYLGTNLELVEPVIAACIDEGWLIRKIFPDGQRYTMYPTGEVVCEKQEDLFG